MHRAVVRTRVSFYLGQARQSSSDESYKSLHEKLKAILSSPAAKAPPSPAATPKPDASAPPTEDVKSIHQRLSDILSRTYEDKGTTAAGSGKNNKSKKPNAHASKKDAGGYAGASEKSGNEESNVVETDLDEELEAEMRLQHTIWEEGPNAEYYRQISAALDRMELEEFPLFEENPDSSDQIEAALFKAEEAGELKFVPDRIEPPADPTGHGIREREILLRDQQEFNYQPLSDAEVLELAQSRVMTRFGKIPTQIRQKLIETEVQRIRSWDLSPAAIRYYRRIRAVTLHRPIARGHPRAKGLCQLSGPLAPPVVHENVNLLSQYISFGGQIKPARVTGVSAFMQRKLTRAIKRSRQLGLIPYMERLPLPHIARVPVPGEQPRQRISNSSRSEKGDKTDKGSARSTA